MLFVALISLFAIGILISLSLPTGGDEEPLARIPKEVRASPWPPPDAVVEHYLGIQVALTDWGREARVDTIHEVDPQLRRLRAAIEARTFPADHAVRLKRHDASKPEDAELLTLEVAIAAACVSLDFDEVLDQLLNVMRKCGEIGEAPLVPIPPWWESGVWPRPNSSAIDRAPVTAKQGALVARLLLRHVRHPKVAALARVLLDSRSGILRAEAACALKDEGVLVALLREASLPAEDIDRITSVLIKSHPKRARAVARQLLRSGAPPSAALLLGALCPPHLRPEDLKVFAATLRRPYADPRVRALALERLGELGTEEARGELLRLLRHAELDLAEPVAALLESLGEPRAHSVLAERLASGDNAEQIFAATWLGVLGSLDDVAPLIAVRDRLLEQPRVKRAAALAVTALQSGATGAAGALSLANAEQTGDLSLADDEAGAVSLAGDGET